MKKETKDALSCVSNWSLGSGAETLPSAELEKTCWMATVESIFLIGRQGLSVPRYSRSILLDFIESWPLNARKTAPTTEPGHALPDFKHLAHSG